MKSTEEIGREMIADEAQWIVWPVLRVVRRKDVQAGVIFAPISKRPISVFLINYFDCHDRTIGDIKENVEHVEYDSIDDLLAEWRID